MAAMGCARRLPDPTRASGRVVALQIAAPTPAASNVSMGVGRVRAALTRRQDQAASGLHSSRDTPRGGSRASTTNAGVQFDQLTPEANDPVRPLPKPSPIYYAAPQVQQLLDMLDVFNINVGSLGLPLQCIGLGGYEDHLSFTILASTAC